MDNTLDNSASVNPTVGAFHPGTVGAAHLLLVAVLLGLFAAAQSWHPLSVPPLAATALSVIAGAIAGAVTCTLVHEWFHYGGALLARGHYTRPSRLALFAFEWDFKNNSRRQFLTMSYAGTLGSLVAIVTFMLNVPATSPGGIALWSASVGSLAFAGGIEWQVIARVRAGGDPLTELAKTTPRVVLSSGFVGLLTALIVALMLL